PSLTTVRQPLETMGDLAVNAVLDGSNASQEKRDWTISHQKTSPELVIRESTRAVSLSTADD
ncbi:MAG: substrate-binding domain-containing protein, partial [Acidobacteria bacterium]|nr:substrate-binding domain-containing protein [Acidobacteriota bacterium]